MQQISSDYNAPTNLFSTPNELYTVTTLSLPASSWLCPNCAAVSKPIVLHKGKAPDAEYLCPECGMSYTTANLAETYYAVIAEALADKNYYEDEYNKLKQHVEHNSQPQIIFN